jgi:uncharacterized membrane protein (UPF0182 family)
VVVILVLLFLLPALDRLVVERWWFQSLGYDRVFLTQLISRLVLFFMGAAAAFVIVYTNVRVAMRGMVARPRVVEATSPIPVAITVLLRRVARPVAIAVAFLTGLATTANWMTVLRFIHRTPFGVADPVFHHDVGYYIFTVPFVAAVLRFFTVMTVLSLILTVFLYALRRDIGLGPVRRMTIEGRARIHVALLIAAMFVLTALRIGFVRIPGLLHSTMGPLTGASYANLHGSLLGLRLAAITAVGLAVFVRRTPPARHHALRGNLPGCADSRRRRVSHAHQSAGRRTQRARQRNAAARKPHRCHAPRVGTRQRGDARSDR